jgi:hypothetical protein
MDRPLVGDSALENLQNQEGGTWMPDSERLGQASEISKYRTAGSKIPISHPKSGRVLLQNQLPFGLDEAMAGFLSCLLNGKVAG